MPHSPLFERITIIGLGLIGSSIARAAHAKKLAGSIAGCDESEISLAYARKHGFIDSATRDPAIAVQGSDLVILATPPSTLETVARAIAPGLTPGAIVMDVCSVKQAAIAAIAPHLPDGVDFIPAHPIAGSEHTGVSAGRADLFKRKRVVVTPDQPLQNQAMQNITSFWQGVGARVEGMPPHLHDMIYGYVSHLPQLLAFAAAGPLAAHRTLEDGDETLHKFLRLAASSPDLWVDIFLLNKENIIKSLDRYLDVIHHIRGELSNAPEAGKDEINDMLARTILFPRIAASCLVTTVMEAEKRAGFPFARYAGTGFADFTFPAARPPEEDIERISSQYAAVAVILDDYMAGLRNLRFAIESGNAKALRQLLAGRA